MSLSWDLQQAFRNYEDVIKCDVNRDAMQHGEKATVVMVTLKDGRTVTGLFTTLSRGGFGGVEFTSQKDIPHLMRKKVDSVLAGTAEES